MELNRGCVPCVIITQSCGRGNAAAARLHSANRDTMHFSGRLDGSLDAFILVSAAFASSLQVAISAGISDGDTQRILDFCAGPVTRQAAKLDRWAHGVQVDEDFDPDSAAKRIDHWANSMLDFSLDIAAHARG